MSSQNRRAAGIRRAWGRGPIILKLENLERRELLAAGASSTLPDLVNSSLTTQPATADWGQSLEVQGRVKNQGGGTTTAPFEIAIYVSPIRGIDRYSLPVGYVQIPAGLAPGESIPYQTSIAIPATPIPDVNSTGGTLYVTAVVNSTHSVTESNYHNDEDLGPPFDTDAVLIEPKIPSNLIGTTLVVSPTDPTWGSTITVTAQITNQSSGSSPQTRGPLIADAPGAYVWRIDLGRYRQHHCSPAGAVPDYQSGPEHHFASRRALVDRQLHELRADDDARCRLRHQ